MTGPGGLVLGDVQAPDLFAGLLLRLQVSPKIAEACLEGRHQGHLEHEKRHREAGAATTLTSNEGKSTSSGAQQRSEWSRRSLRARAWTRLNIGKEHAHQQQQR